MGEAVCGIEMCDLSEVEKMNEPLLLQMFDLSEVTASSTSERSHIVFSKSGSHFHKNLY
jgi:hypothetical protein